MSDPEKYAKPGLYLDTDDHARLIEENREAYERERWERLLRERERIDAELRAMAEKRERHR